MELQQGQTEGAVFFVQFGLPTRRLSDALGVTLFGQHVLHEVGQFVGGGESVVVQAELQVRRGVSRV